MELVYMDGKKEPYTLSSIVAECADVKHRHLKNFAELSTERTLKALERCNLKFHLQKVGKMYGTIF